MGLWGVENGRKSEKTAFSEKAKWVLSFKKKIGSPAPEPSFWGLVGCRADFRVWPEMGLGGGLGVVPGRNLAKMKQISTN